MHWKSAYSLCHTITGKFLNLNPITVPATSTLWRKQAFDNHNNTNNKLNILCSLENYSALHLLS